MNIRLEAALLALKWAGQTLLVTLAVLGIFFLLPAGICLLFGLNDIGQISILVGSFIFISMFGFVFYTEALDHIKFERDSKKYYKH